MSSMKLSRAWVLCALLVLTACQDNMNPDESQPHEVTVRLSLTARDVAAVHIDIDASIQSIRTAEGVSLFGEGNENGELVFLADRIFEGESIVLARMTITGACNARLVSVATEEGEESTDLDGYRISCRTE